LQGTCLGLRSSLDVSIATLPALTGVSISQWIFFKFILKRFYVLARDGETRVNGQCPKGEETVGDANHRDRLGRALVAEMLLNVQSEHTTKESLVGQPP